MKVLRIILNNHLNTKISSLEECDKENDIIMMCEAKEEFTYVKHHKKKIAFFISAMRHFAQELIEDGYNVYYVKLDDPKNTGFLSQEIKRAYNKFRVDKIVLAYPGEYRILNDISSLKSSISAEVEIKEDNLFLCSRTTFNKWADTHKQLRMEFFYRFLRKKYKVLMNGENPLGGRWNYDAENRKFPKTNLNIPKSYESNLDSISQEAIKLVEQYFSDHFGDLEPFYFAVNKKQALKALKLFIEERLKDFGKYQDAMLENEPWMYHSHISFYLNTGLLLPGECIKAAEKAYFDGHAPLNAVEGFIRQILGWREYIRGVYWREMPKYKDCNFLEARNKLPAFFWDADTKMNCLKQSITQTKNNAYAHHIQRLMVIGNFCLLAGIDPKEVNEWYLIVYADAFEWVELPNVTGMTLFADGGILGSKPYAASSTYINKMSNYCQNCVYDPKEKIGPKACPFNYLYWDFLIRNQSKISSNHRLRMIYNNIYQMSDEKISAIKRDAKNFLSHIS